MGEAETNRVIQWCRLEKMEMSKLASKIRFEDEVKRLGCVQLVPGTVQIFLFVTEKN